MSIMTIGDFAVLSKPSIYHNVGTSVQIASVNVVRGKVQYTAAVLFKDRLTDVIGPIVAESFVFVRQGTDTHVAALIAHVTQHQKEELRQRTERQRVKHAQNCMCDDCILI